MSNPTTIEWTERNWNPVMGCSPASEGCRNCYAMQIAARFSAPGKPFDGHAGFVDRERPGPDRALRTVKEARWTGTVTELNDRLNEPDRVKTDSVIFVSSMTDIFHKNVSDDFLRKIFETMNRNTKHVFQVLTKRPDRLVDKSTGAPTPLAERLVWTDNILLGASVEDAEVLWRVECVRNSPAKWKWLSCEPLIGPLTGLDLRNIHWVVVGGESGSDREMLFQWVRDIKQECGSHGTKFFMKQLGTVQSKRLLGRCDKGSKSFDAWPDYLDDIRVREYPQPILDLRAKLAAQAAKSQTTPSPAAPPQTPPSQAAQSPAPPSQGGNP